MTDDEARYVGSAVVQVIRNYKTWREDYDFHQDSGEFTRKLGELSIPDLMSEFIPV